MEHKKFQNKVLIIYSNFYSEISDNLLDGATKFLKKENILYETLCVPGSLEIPFFLKKNREKFSGYIILGCIIKGETDHYEVVKKSTFNSIYKFSYDYSFPLSTALLTVNNYDQALERSKVNKKNLGGNAAKVCLDLISKLNEK